MKVVRIWNLVEPEESHRSYINGLPYFIHSRRGYNSFGCFYKVSHAFGDKKIIYLKQQNIGTISNVLKTRFDKL